MRLAVRRMLPKSPLGRQMLKKLKVYGGPTHPHFAQQPVDHAAPGAFTGAHERLISIPKDCSCPSP